MKKMIVIIAFISVIFVVVLDSYINQKSDDIGISRADPLRKDFVTQTCSTRNEKNIMDDLVYRQYSFGKYFTSGELVITKESILKISNCPKCIIVYFGNKLLETKEFEDDDIKIELIKDGVYWFSLVNQDNKMVDVTDKAQGTSYIGNDTLLKLK